MEDSADDDHRMRAHDVNHGVPAKFSKMVGADDRVVVKLPYMIYPGFEFNQIVRVRLPFSRPVHSANDSAQGKSSRSIATGDLFERLEHSILIKLAIAEVSFGIGSKL